MTTTRLSRLIVKCTAGAHPGEAERANQALTVAATGALSGLDVNLWLAGEATYFAVPARAADLRVAHGTPAGELIEQVLQAGQVTACGQCATRRGIEPADVLPGVRIAGAAVFLDESLDASARVLVY